jgi:hypothetical protein
MSKVWVDLFGQAVFIASVQGFAYAAPKQRFLQVQVYKQWSRVYGRQDKQTAVSTIFDSVGILDWSIQYGGYRLQCDLKTLETAVKHGHVSVLQYLKDQYSADFTQSSEDRTDSATVLCTTASRRGHLVILKWLREQGCEWNDDVCIAALAERHLECLQYAMDNGLWCNLLESTAGHHSINS